MGAITFRTYWSMCSKCPMGGVVHLIAKAESIIFCVSCLCFVILERCMLCPARNIHVYVVQVSTSG